MNVNRLVIPFLNARSYASSYIRLRLLLLVFVLTFSFGFIFESVAQERNERTGLIIGRFGLKSKKTGQRGISAGGGSGTGGTNFSVGFRAGTNTATVNASDPLTAIEFIGTSNFEREDKKYVKGSELRGKYFSAVIQYYIFAGISVNIQPGFSSYGYGYNRRIDWVNPADAAQTYFVQQQQRFNLTYFDIPLMIRYAPIQYFVSPYVEVGGYYSTLLTAERNFLSKEINPEQTGFREVTREEFRQLNTDQFLKSSLGVQVGAGASFRISVINLELGVNYRLGLSDMVDEGKRGEINQFVTRGYDFMDQVKANNLILYAGLRFGI